MNDKNKDEIDNDDKIEQRSKESTDDIEPKKKHGLVAKVLRIPWKEYIRSKFVIILGSLIMMVMLLYIIALSEVITGHYAINSPHVLEFNTNAALLLTFLSSLLFLLVLFTFTRMVFLDKREDFGIESMKSARSIWFFLLTVSFLSQVYILLDVSLVNVYLITGPAYLIQWIANQVAPGTITSATNRVAYSDIRSLVFLVLFVFNLIFPVLMFIIILTRFGRGFFKDRRVKNWKKSNKRLIFQSIILGLATNIIVVIGGSIDLSSSILVIPYIIVLGGILVWLTGTVMILLYRLVRFLLIFGFTNLSMILPIVFIFYILPALIWGAWDVFVVFTTDSIKNTIYEFSFMQNKTPVMNPLSVEGRSWSDILWFYLFTTMYNSQSIVRTIQLDFIIIMGIASFVIGTAEGFSIFAIVRSIRTGVNITRTGRVVTRSAPRMIVLTTKLLMLFTWFSLLWDKTVSFWDYLVLSLPDWNLPDFDLPIVIEPIYNISIKILSLNNLLLPLTILLLPFYFILTSSFKFLSVSIAAERTEDDNQIFFLLISSAFILIVTKIYADIAVLPDFLTVQKAFLPLRNLPVENILPFIIKINDLLETIGFYVGFVVSLVVMIRRILRIKKNKDINE